MILSHAKIEILLFFFSKYLPCSKFFVHAAVGKSGFHGISTFLVFVFFIMIIVHGKHNIFLSTRATVKHKMFYMDNLMGGDGSCMHPVKRHRRKFDDQQVFNQEYRRNKVDTRVVTLACEDVFYSFPLQYTGLICSC